MKHFYIIFTILFLSSCSSAKYNLATDTSDIEASAIHNAIEIFSTTKPKIYKNDSVFYVTFFDSIFRLTSKEVQPDEWVRVRDTYYENLSAVDILGNSDFQYFLTPDIKIGNKTKIIPTRFIEKNGKLFLWGDYDYPITEELLVVLHKNNLFLEDPGWFFPDNIIDDSKKGFTYLFCKDNLKKYKIIITSFALGSFDIPKIKCE